MSNDTDFYKLATTYAGLPRTTRGRQSHISADPKGKNFLYCQGNSVIIRDAEECSQSDVYTQHSKDTTSAAYAPSGFYICSGDVSGKVRIWDTTNAGHILKYEYPALGGAIKDIAWTEDSKRIAVCGEGREKYANAIMWDTGTSVGKLDGIASSCNNVAIKQNRPYRLALASEDYSSYFYEGPPFKINSTKKEHTNFVNCVRYAPDGSKYATAGADGRCFVYDGKTGELIGEMNEAMGKIHNGGVYGLSWSPDSKKLMTCSADKTVKIWNMDEKNFISNEEETMFTLGKNLDDMQVGCLWMGDHLISISLSGVLNFLDPSNPDAPKKVIKGHNKSIVASCLNDDRTLMFTASFDGVVCKWDLATGVAEFVGGKRHSNQVNSMVSQGDTVATCGMDDTIRFISIKDNAYTDSVVKLDSQPSSCAIGKMGMVAVGCVNSIYVIQDGKVSHRYKSPGFNPTSIAVSSDLAKVVVGMEEGKVVVYSIEGDQLKESGSFPANGNVTSVKFSPDNQYVALSTGKKQVKVVQTSDFKTEVANWASHAAKVNGVNWTPNSLYLASSGVDGSVVVWNVMKDTKQFTIRGAHSQSVDVTSVQWKDDNTLLTCGRQDCSIKTWDVKH